MASYLRPSPERPRDLLVGVGGIGTGLYFELEGNHALGREESRPGRLRDVRDYCKLHIIAHYIAVLLGAHPSGRPFRAVPIGKVGDDAAGRRLREEMAEAGMDVAFVEAVPGQPTLLGVCFQYPDGTGGNITPTESAASSLTAADVDRAAPLLAAHAGRSIALAAPEVPLGLRRHLLDLATAHGAFRVAACTSAEMAAAERTGFFGRVDLLAMNRDEAAALVGCPFDTEAPGPMLQEVAARLTAAQPDMRIIVTAGRDGAHGYEDGAWHFAPALSVPVASTAGAGDALLGAVTAAMAAGAGLEPALRFGTLLAGYTVTSPHTIHPDARLDAVLAFAARIGAAVPPEIESLATG